MRAPRTLKELVKAVRLKSSAARQDDTSLILEVWKAEGAPISKETEMFIKGWCSNPESIRRERQKLDESGYYSVADAQTEIRWG